MYYNDFDTVGFHEKAQSQILTVSRSITPEVFLEKGVLKMQCKFAGEHPCRSVI